MFHFFKNKCQLRRYIKKLEQNLNEDHHKLSSLLGRNDLNYKNIKIGKRNVLYGNHRGNLYILKFKNKKLLIGNPIQFNHHKKYYCLRINFEDFEKSHDHKGNQDILCIENYLIFTEINQFENKNISTLIDLANKTSLKDYNDRAKKIQILKIKDYISKINALNNQPLI